MFINNHLSFASARNYVYVPQFQLNPHKVHTRVAMARTRFERRDVGHRTEYPFEYFTRGAAANMRKTGMQFTETLKFA